MKKPFHSSSVVETSRDILLLGIGQGRLLAVSCDAAGGIGSKLHDKVKVEAHLVGKMTARVALMELLATGTDPMALVATLAVEPEPTANLVIEGVREEVRNARFGNLPILCSTEKNVKVTQTGVGITAFGIVSPPHLKVGWCKPEDQVIAIGDRCVGQEVVGAEKNRRVADSLDVVRLRKHSFVHELIPVGSKGILYEARVIAHDSGLVFKPLRSQTLGLKKSAGPATVLLCAIRRGSFAKTQQLLRPKPVRMIGVLGKK